jgi:hypothetical protein
MKLLALIVDNRDIDFKPIYDRHLPHLPEGTKSIHYKPKIKSIADYNKLFTSPKFWRKFVDYDMVLIFQHDSALLRSGIEDFYQYDYIGAPWKFQQHGGNGGLSLRNPRIMLYICNTFTYNNRENEDVYFSNIMHRHNVGNLAPRNECAKFAVETIYSLGTFGYHAIDKYLTKEELESVQTQYD